MWVLLVLGCTSDACRLLCATTAQRLEECLPEWGATWEDFDATSRVDYGDRCRAQWDDERLTLELRQLDVANGECTTADDELTGNNGADKLSCDELRPLYVEP